MNRKKKSGWILIMEPTIRWIKKSYSLSDKFIRTLPKFIPVVFGYVFSILFFHFLKFNFPKMPDFIIILLILLSAILLLLILGLVLNLIGFKKK